MLFILDKSNSKFMIIFCSSHFWVSLSSLYGKFLVLLMLAFCLTEVMDNNIRPLLFQELDLFTFTLMLGCVIPALWMVKQITQPRTL